MHSEKKKSWKNFSTELVSCDNRWKRAPSVLSQKVHVHILMKELFTIFRFPHRRFVSFCLSPASAQEACGETHRHEPCALSFLFSEVVVGGVCGFVVIA